MENEFHGRVRAVDRAMMLLEAIGGSDGGNRLVDLASRTGMSPSTVHRLLTTLEHRKFVQFNPSDGLWHVGRQAFAIGSAFMRERNFVAPALPLLKRLRNQTRETVNLGVVEEGEIVVINQVESREIGRSISRVGGHAPMSASGMGKAVLASYSTEEISAVIATHGMRRMTTKSLTRRPSLEAELLTIRQTGYAVDDEELMPGLRCVASAVYNDQAQVLCAVSISGLPSRISTERVPVLGRLVAATARELTLSLGGAVPV